MAKYVTTRGGDGFVAEVLEAQTAAEWRQASSRGRVRCVLVIAGMMTMSTCSEEERRKLTCYHGARQT